MTFSSQVDNLLDKAADKASKRVRGTVLGIMRDTIKDTPVDTGRLRGNWFSSIGSPVDATPEGRTMGASMSNAVDVTKKFNIGDDVYFTNNLPYAYIVEFGGMVNGHPRKGVGMLRRSIGIRTSKLR